MILQTNRVEKDSSFYKQINANFWGKSLVQSSVNSPTFDEQLFCQFFLKKKYKHKL